MHPSLLESVIVTEFKATEADLTKAKYIIRNQSLEKENVSVRINLNNLIACETRKST
jgi:hypothetical protein